MILFKQIIFFLLITFEVEKVYSNKSSEAICNCLNNGTCIESSNCNCEKGFYGEMCQYTFCNNNEEQCNNGTCLKDTRTNKKLCKCKPTHKGALCEISICSNYCYNDGKCSYDQSDYSDYLNRTYSIDLNCECKSERFSGDRCQFDKCWNRSKKCPEHSFLGPDCQCVKESDCDKVFCNNNGVCDHLNDSLICNCFQGFNGTRCKESIENRPIYRTRSSLKFIIYALTITFLVCLFVVGCFYSLQKSNIREIPHLDHIRQSTFLARNRFQKDFGFSKLEDEQIIIQNDPFVNA